MARVVVVGAGLGGLAAAARLAALGHAVTVCEQAPGVGGKLGVFERDGFVFDTGPSLLTLPAVYRDLFLATGDPNAAHADFVYPSRSDGQSSYIRQVASLLPSTTPPRPPAAFTARTRARSSSTSLRTAR